MCNVPEIAMCFHLNGIVQGYELFKTEDLPNLENSAFSPSVVQDTGFFFLISFFLLSFIFCFI